MGASQRLKSDISRLQNEVEAARIRHDNARAAALAKERECDELFADWECAKEAAPAAVAREALDAHQKRQRWCVCRRPRIRRGPCMR